MGCGLAVGCAKAFASELVVYSHMRLYQHSTSIPCGRIDHISFIEPVALHDCRRSGDVPITTGYADDVCANSVVAQTMHVSLALATLS